MRHKITFRLPTPVLFAVVLLYAIALYFQAERTRKPLPEQDLSICLYSNQAGDNLRQTFTQAILRAKVSIVCLIYSLNDDEIIAALRQQAEKGVDVLIIHDPVATQDVTMRLGPKVRLVGRRQKGLMHNKLLAIDHTQAWFGSANFTKDSLLLHANLVVGFYSPLMAKAIEEKAEQLLCPKPKRLNCLTIHSNQQTCSLSFLPDDKEALDKVIAQLQAATKTIKVAMFTFTHPKLADALVTAHKRGVQVDVVIDHDSSRRTSLLVLEKLKREKVAVYVSNRKGLLHEKVAIIDDQTLIMGSANWTKAAFTANDENLLILFDLSTEQKETLSRFWQTTLAESRPAA